MSSNTSRRGTHAYRVTYPSHKPFDVRADGISYTADRVGLILRPEPGATDRREVHVLMAAWSSGICITRVDAIVHDTAEGDQS